MTPEEARIVILEDALMQAVHTVEFLHGCLTEPSLEEAGRVQAAAIRRLVRGDTQRHGAYSLVYPDQNLQSLERWRQLVTMPKLCHHSRFKPECAACVEALAHRTKMDEAQETLKTAVSPEPQK